MGTVFNGKNGTLLPNKIEVTPRGPQRQKSYYYLYIYIFSCAPSFTKQNIRIFNLYTYVIYFVIFIVTKIYLIIHIYCSAFDGTHRGIFGERGMKRSVLTVPRYDHPHDPYHRGR